MLKTETSALGKNEIVAKYSFLIGWNWIWELTLKKISEKISSSFVKLYYQIFWK
jgi:hypothetical protein